MTTRRFPNVFIHFINVLKIDVISKAPLILDTLYIEKKVRLEIYLPKLCISFFGIHLVPAENVLVKNRNNDSCESSFPPAGLQKFSMNESITESKKFLGKGKSFIRSQSLKLKWRKFMFQTISDHFR